jgi:hypothetical protein
MAQFFTEVDGILFTEGNLEGKVLGPIKEFGATQNTVLGDVKKLMAAKARMMGGNAVINFTYTQKADRGLHLLKWDRERLNCSGVVIVLSEDPRKQTS